MGFENLFFVTLRQLGRDIDQLEHLDRLEDIELNCVNRSIPEATFTKTGETEELLKLEQIFAYQENHPILKDISLTIPKGQRLAIVGKEWAGNQLLRKPSVDSLPQKGNTPLEAKISSRRVSRNGLSESAMSCKTPIKMISTNMIFDEVALGLRLRGYRKKISKSVSIKC